MPQKTLCTDKELAFPFASQTRAAVLRQRRNTRAPGMMLRGAEGAAHAWPLCPPRGTPATTQCHCAGLNGVDSCKSRDRLVIKLPIKRLRLLFH